MFKATAVAAAMLGLASAAPTSQNKLYSLDQLSRFDNTDGVPLVAAEPIGIYNDILFNGMSLVVTTGSQSVPGVLPNTAPSYAAYSALDTATLTQGQPSMSVNYPDSTIDHFDLKSFYYGCAVASEASVAGVPAQCTITIKGYSDLNGQDLAASQTFEYDVSALDLQKQMYKANVNAGFKGVKKVDFFVSNDALTAAVIDTVDYTVYSDSKIGN